MLSQYAHWDIPAIGQAYILFKAKLAAPFTFSSGPESLEVALFEPDSIPFDQIAFSSVSITLRHYLQVGSSTHCESCACFPCFDVSLVRA